MLIKCRRMRWPGHVARIAGTRHAYSVLIGRSQCKTSLGKGNRRRMDNTQTDNGEIEYEGVDGI
jgi:hypothetical protein